MRLFLGLALVLGLGYAKVVVNRAGYFSFSNSESTPSLYTLTQKHPKVTFLKFFKKRDKSKILKLASKYKKDIALEIPYSKDIAKAYSKGIPVLIPNITSVIK